MENYTIKDRIEMTTGNIEFQGGALWDDIEKMEHILVSLLIGKKLDDEFVFIPNHLEILTKHIKSLKQ